MTPDALTLGATALGLAALLLLAGYLLAQVERYWHCRRHGHSWSPAIDCQPTARQFDDRRVIAAGAYCQCWRCGKVETVRRQLIETTASDPPPDGWRIV